MESLSGPASQQGKAKFGESGKEERMRRSRLYCKILLENEPAFAKNSHTGTYERGGCGCHLGASIAPKNGSSSLMSLKLELRGYRVFEKVTPYPPRPSGGLSLLAGRAGKGQRSQNFMCKCCGHEHFFRIHVVRGAPCIPTRSWTFAPAMTVRCGG